MDHRDWIRGLVASLNSSLAGLDFAVPIAFIALAFRTVPQVVEAFTAAELSLAFAAILYWLGLIIGAFVALLLGAELGRHIQTTSWIVLLSRFLF